MKFKIEKENGEIKVFDNKGNKVYVKSSDGYWVKRKLDIKRNLICWESRDGGSWTEKPIPKPKIIEAKDLDECLEKLEKGKK